MCNSAPPQMLLIVYAILKNHEKANEKSMLRLEKLKNHIKLGVSLFIKLAVFERTFCNGNKKWPSTIKAVTQRGFVLESGRICVS